MPVRKGTLAHVKGFIMNKLFEEGCLSRGTSHGKHMPSRNLRTGYDPRYHGQFDSAVEELRREGLILQFPARTGQGSEPHVVAVKERLLEARALINAYRRSVGLQPLRRDLREFPEEN